MGSRNNIQRHKSLLFTNNKFIILPKITFKVEAFISKVPIVFVHTSKTGGTSIDYLAKYISSHNNLEYLQAYFRCSGYSSCNFFPEGCLGGINLIKKYPEKYTMDDKPTVQFLLGHIPLPTSDYFQKTVHYISIVRDPVDRLISLGNFIYQRKLMPDTKIVNFITSVELDNLQTRALAGEEHMNGPCNEEIYQKAIYNVKTKFALVAPTEEVDLVMAIFVNHFNIENLAYTRAQITGVKFIDQNDYNLYQQLLERNAYDKKLYDFINQYWQEWKDNHIESISDNLDYNTNYTVLTSSYYNSKKIEYMNLTEMQFCETNQDGELIGITQL